MAAGDVVRVGLINQGPSGEELVNVLHYVQSSGGLNLTVSQMDAFASAFAAVLMAPLLVIASLAVTRGNTVATILNGASLGYQGYDTTAVGTPGGTSGTDGAIERCLLYRKSTGIAGKKFRGRLFAPMPCLETFNTDGTYNPSNPDHANQIALFTVLMTPVLDPNSAPWVPCIWHQATLTSTKIVDFTISSLVGIQRNRRAGIGA